MDWRKSSYSGANGGQCVEVASAEVIAIRDTVDRTGVTLQFSPKHGSSSRAACAVLAADRYFRLRILLEPRQESRCHR
jgi:hypothetical protein